MGLWTRAGAEPDREACWRRRIAAVGLGFAIASAAGAAASAATFEEGVAAQSRGDLPAAVAAYQAAADRGESAAEFALGRLYLTGQAVAQSYRAARGWFEKAAAQGNPGAACELGEMYEEGRGAPREYAAALVWYRQSAARGYVPAEVRLAEMYRRGVGVPRDLSAAIGLVTPAANAGDASGELELGMLYDEAARKPPRAGAALNRTEFRALLDQVFGHDNWLETSGYRTPAQENRLRAAGAGTVPIGEISRHSLGTEGAPGAYDIVVPGMTADAAAKVLRSSARFGRVLAERAHGEQGPHLHVELLLGAAYAAHVDAPRRGEISTTGPAATPAEFAEQARHWLRLAAGQGEAEAAQVLATLQTGRSPS